MAVHHTLVLGGVSSGKSAYAEALAAASGSERVYLATASAGDAEMQARIDVHRARRGAGWQLVEEPLELTRALLRETAPHRIALVDCLTLWLTNLMVAGREVAGECDALVASIPSWRGPVILVSNEVGLGGIEPNAMARAFADHAGRLHQHLAKVVGSVVLVAAGLPLFLKQPTQTGHEFAPIGDATRRVPPGRAGG